MLTLGQITTALDNHGIRYQVLDHGNSVKVIAWEEATRVTPTGPEDASGWVTVPATRSGLMSWLGY